MNALSTVIEVGSHGPPDDRREYVAFSGKGDVGHFKFYHTGTSSAPSNTMGKVTNPHVSLCKMYPTETLRKIMSGVQQHEVGLLLDKKNPMIIQVILKRDTDDKIIVVVSDQNTNE